MAEMVERVAKSIYETWANIEGSDVTWEELAERNAMDGYPNAKKWYAMAHLEARAAIQAMCEPTEAMNANMVEALNDYADPWAVWQAGLAAALLPAPPKPA